MIFAGAAIGILFPILMQIVDFKSPTSLAKGFFISLASFLLMSIILSILSWLLSQGITTKWLNVIIAAPIEDVIKCGFIFIAFNASESKRRVAWVGYFFGFIEVAFLPIKFNSPYEFGFPIFFASILRPTIHVLFVILQARAIFNRRWAHLTILSLIHISYNVTPFIFYSLGSAGLFSVYVNEAAISILARELFYITLFLIYGKILAEKFDA